MRRTQDEEHCVMERERSKRSCAECETNGVHTNTTAHTNTHTHTRTHTLPTGANGNRQRSQLRGRRCFTNNAVMGSSQCSQSRRLPGRVPTHTNTEVRAHTVAADRQSLSQKIVSKAAVEWLRGSAAASLLPKSFVFSIERDSFFLFRRFAARARDQQQQQHCSCCPLRCCRQRRHHTLDWIAKRATTAATTK